MNRLSIPATSEIPTAFTVPTAHLRTARIEGLKEFFSITKVISLYRIISLVLTSVFYLAGNHQSPLKYKLLLVGCLSIAAVVSIFIFTKFENSKSIIKGIVILETVFNIIILLPTGGLNSPYIWYSLNTVIVTTYFLSMYFFCFNLLTYTAALAVISFYINNENGNNITSFLLNNYNLILSYTMIIVSIWQMMKLVKKLNIDRHNLVKVNNELVEANKLLDESLQYIASLYQAVQNFVNTNSKKKLLCIIAQHVKDITKTPMAFIYLQFENNEEAFETSDAITEDMKIFLLNKFRKDTSFNTYSDDLLTYNYKTKNLIAVNIKSCHEVRGVIGIEVGIRDKGMIEKERVYQIRFLASLSTFIFEKFKIEDMNHKLLIAEEQSRIANEIHDSVSQNLFFISSKLYSISHRYTDGNNIELKNEIDLVNNSLKNAMKELREAIYSYSGKLEEDTPFENNLKKYIDEVSKLNDVNIIVNVTGNQELSDYDVKRIIYRIIYEAVANAIRHGRSKNIFINLQMEKGEVKLDIEDDGTGFDLKSKMLNNSMGLGIKNINNLVYSLNGDIKIDSKPTQGTMIKISFPNLNIVKENRSEAL